MNPQPPAPAPPPTWRQRLLVGVVLAGLLLLAVFVVTPIGGGLLLLFVFLGNGAAAPLIFLLMALGGGLCLVIRGIMVLCGVSGGRAWVAASFLAAIPVILLGATLFLQPAGNGTNEDTVQLGKQVALADLKIVRGVPGCTQTCVAGTLTNQGTQSLASVTLALDFQDASRRSLGIRVVTPVTWTPAGKLAPGETAAFLYLPPPGVLAIGPQLAGVSGEVGRAGTADPSASRFTRALSRWVFRKPQDLLGK